jgi:hypothetical protein
MSHKTWERLAWSKNWLSTACLAGLKALEGRLRYPEPSQVLPRLSLCQGMVNTGLRLLWH